jgi:hypothetical protein
MKAIFQVMPLTQKKLLSWSLGCLALGAKINYFYEYASSF